MSSSNIRSALMLVSMAAGFATPTAFSADISPAFKGESFKRQQDAPTPRIVGGEEAQPGDWPFMTALVRVVRTADTSLTVDSTAFSSTFFDFGAEGSAAGELASCGLAGQVCEDVQGKVCLIQRGTFDFAVKADNCELGGGVGAIIYNNEEGNIENGTMTSDYTGSIPVVAVSRADGNTLESNLGASVSLSVEYTGISAQSSSCGATYLGDRWVMTAAHCLEGAISNTLVYNVGEFDLADGAENAVTPEVIFVHPEYQDGTFDYDIALVRLSSEINAQAVQIADKATTDQFVQANAVATTIGWGGRDGYEPGQGPTGNFPDRLHEVDTNLLTNQQCRNTFAASLGTIPEATGVTDRMVCTEAPGKSACQGDSGGPLLIDTNTGYQQIGIVSWGRGCAASGYPGVYARIAEFEQWRTDTMTGVVIARPELFSTTTLDATSSIIATVANNTDVEQELTFSINGSSDFSITDNPCQTIAADSICKISITYTPSQAGAAFATVDVTTANSGVTTVGADIAAEALAEAPLIADNFPLGETTVDWFSGGDASWTLNGAGEAQSGNINDLQRSVLQARVVGAGTLNFEWAISSEENTEDPSDPFDALYVSVNNREMSFISGEVNFTEFFVVLPEGTNIVEWSYEKDFSASAGEDNARIRNVTFTPLNSEPAPPPPPPPAPPPSQPAPSDGGGGSIGWLLLPLAGCAVLRVRRRRARYQ